MRATHQKGHIEGDKYIRHVDGKPKPKKVPHQSHKPPKPQPRDGIKGKPTTDYNQFKAKVGGIPGTKFPGKSGQMPVGGPRPGMHPSNKGPIGSMAPGFKPGPGMAPHPMGMAPPMGQQPPQMGINPPSMGMMPPPMGMNPPPIGQQPPPMGMTSPPMGQQPPPMGMNPPPMGQPIPKQRPPQWWIQQIIIILFIDIKLSYLYNLWTGHISLFKILNMDNSSPIFLIYWGVRHVIEIFW